MEVQRNHFEQLTCVYTLQAQSDIVLKLHVLIVLADIGPRQFVPINQIDQNVESRLNIVPSTLIEPPARIQRGKHEIPSESIHLPFLNMLAILIQISLRQAEIN